MTDVPVIPNTNFNEAPMPPQANTVQSQNSLGNQTAGGYRGRLSTMRQSMDSQ
jgi:hypothetical protein